MLFHTVRQCYFILLETATLICYTVREVLEDFAVFDWWRFCKALCDVKFRKIEGNGRKFHQIKLSNISSSFKISNSVEKVTLYTVGKGYGQLTEKATSYGWTLDKAISYCYKILFTTDKF